MRWISGLSSFIFLLGVATAWGQECTISTIPVQFGSYNFINPSPEETVGSIRVGCAQGTAFTLKLGPGENSGGSFQPRKMRSATSGETLNYNLYRDPARVEVWGDGTNSTFVQIGVATTVGNNINVYGRVFARQNAGVGFYRDSIIVIVEW